MKKLAVLLAVVSIAALAAPAFSAATNPFMDVPMNHWAYDAIGQLAAHGILSGYPDGLYKGQQPTTRYEMASALARALAVVDMTKASKQDVEMLKRLVVEFKDELEQLGVRVDELDERVAVLEDRLGGWHIHGFMALDFKYTKSNEPGMGGDSEFAFDDAKLFFERRWGEDDEYFFQARIEHSPTTNRGDGHMRADRFFVEMPFFFDSRLTVGRFVWNLEGDYKIGLPATGSFLGDSGIATNWEWDGLGFTKELGIGSFRAVFAHPGNGDAYRGPFNRNRYTPAVGTDNNGNDWSAYMLMLAFSGNFTEQFGLDIGGEYFKGDNAEDDINYVNANLGNGVYAFDKFWQVWAGLHFNFNDNIALKGIFYHQKMEIEEATAAGWTNVGYNLGDNKDDANHWAVMLDVKQEALKFTSLWLEYGQYDRGFIGRTGDSIFYSPSIDTANAIGKIKYWRIGAGQEWNDKWATHLFYYGYKVEDVLAVAGTEWKPAEFGLGVQYKLNDYTTMGLNYVHVKDYAQGVDEKDNVVRLRTTVSF